MAGQPLMGAHLNRIVKHTHITHDRAHPTLIVKHMHMTRDRPAKLKILMAGLHLMGGPPNPNCKTYTYNSGQDHKPKHSWQAHPSWEPT
jgi:hypothetical protein